MIDPYLIVLGSDAVVGIVDVVQPADRLDLLALVPNSNRLDLGPASRENDNQNEDQNDGC